MLGLAFTVLISCLCSLLDSMSGLVFIVSSLLDLMSGLSFSSLRLIFTLLPVLKLGDATNLVIVVFNFFSP